jgi:hypothetical protein
VVQCKAEASAGAVLMTATSPACPSRQEVRPVEDVGLVSESRMTTLGMHGHVAEREKVKAKTQGRLVDR